MRLYEVFKDEFKSGAGWLVNLTNGSVGFPTKSEAEEFARRLQRQTDLDRANGRPERVLTWVKKDAMPAPSAKTKTICFPAGNEIVYGQDMRFFKGVPSHIDFTYTIKPDGLMELTAPGYGHPGDYGNGSLFIWFTRGKVLEQLQKMIDDKTVYYAALYEAKQHVIETLNNLGLQK